MCRQWKRGSHCHAKHDGFHAGISRAENRDRYAGDPVEQDRQLSKSIYPLKLTSSIKKAAAELAAGDGISLNQLIVAAVAEKAGSLPAAREFLRERAGSSKPKEMLKYQRRAPTVRPTADDQR
jgi:hypothetical protein